ncbi:MAG: dihydroxyacetone kinase subunit DhaK [Armatimonadetes bacterium]|nr:dihydroxyacetone kinase subunit DhaK [Armatimonadota bacterium]
MKKIINDPEAFVDEVIEGILLAHPSHLKRCANTERGLMRADGPIEGKVAIATGGGSGHIPVFLGYVGPGLLDGVSIGNVFSSPSVDAMVEVTKSINAGKGVLYLYGNYSGDTMNFDMAAEMCEMEDIEVRSVRVRDDVVSAPKDAAETRRAVAGVFFGYKIAGAKADTGASLDEVTAVAQKVVENTCSMGVALSPCTIPAVGKPTFELGENEMELGMGIHGERGIEREPIKTADEIADIMTNRVLDDLPFVSGDRVAILVNGLGATPPEELYLLFRKASQVIASRGVSIERVFIGEYATSMEMAGASISLLKLDDELLSLLDAPAYSPFLMQWRQSR